MRYNKNNNRNNLWQHRTTLIGHGNKVLLLKPSDNETFPEIWEYNAAFLQSGGLVDYTGETLKYHTDLFLIISGDEESCMLRRLQVLLFLHVYNFFVSRLLQICFRKKHYFLFYRLPDFRILQAIPKCNM